MPVASVRKFAQESYEKSHDGWEDAIDQSRQLVAEKRESREAAHKAMVEGQYAIIATPKCYTAVPRDVMRKLDGGRRGVTRQIYFTAILISFCGDHV